MVQNGKEKVDGKDTLGMKEVQFEKFGKSTGASVFCKGIEY